MIYSMEFVGGVHDGEDTWGFNPYHELKFPCGCIYERDEKSPEEWIDDETRRLVLTFSKKEPSEIPCK